MGVRANKSRESPFQRKVRDYLRQRVNDYCENDKSSRKAVRLRKRWVNRDFRRALAQRAKAVVLGSEDETVEFSSVTRKRWRKVPDAALIEVLALAAGDSNRFRRNAIASAAQKKARLIIRKMRARTRF